MKTLFALVIGISMAAGCGPSTASIDMCSPTQAKSGAACVPGCDTMSGNCSCDGTTSKWVCTHEDGGTK